MRMLHYGGRLARNRRGMALVLALLSIVFIGLLIVGVFYAARQEFQVGTNSTIQSRAATATEYGLNQVIATWDNQRNISMSNGDTFRLALNTGDQSIDTVVVTKLNRYTYLLVSEGRAGAGTRQEARRKAGTIMRLAYPAIAYTGALTAAGGVSVPALPAKIDGQNQDPNWNSGGSACVYNGEDFPAVSVPDTMKVTYAPGTLTSGAGVILAQDTMAAKPATYNVFGIETWAMLVGGANVLVPPFTGLSPRPWPTPPTASACVTTDMVNWGDFDHSAMHTCMDYFPVVYAQGDLYLSNGTGQGLLLVERNLYITGGFKWVGLILVHGYVKATGMGNSVNGALLAAGTGTVDTLTKSFFGGDFSLKKSTCATETAARGGALARLAKHRSWADLY